MTENTLVERIVEKIAADLMDRVEDDGYCLHKDSIKDVCRKILAVEIMGGMQVRQPADPNAKKDNLLLDPDYLKALEAYKSELYTITKMPTPVRILAPGCGGTGDSTTITGSGAITSTVSDGCNTSLTMDMVRQAKKIMEDNLDKLMSPPMVASEPTEMTATEVKARMAQANKVWGDIVAKRNAAYDDSYN
jgi:hypothetical protein